MDLHHYIVVWTINNHGDFTDHWEVFPNENDAVRHYEWLLSVEDQDNDELWTASVTKVLRSTDYSDKVYVQSLDISL